jgi:hypothetical protein
VCVFPMCVPPRSPHVCVCVRGVPNGGAFGQTCPGIRTEDGSVTIVQALY